MISWFEIPVRDMEKAKAFYEIVFDIKINVQDFGGVLMGWFPFLEGKQGVPGSLIKQESYVPSKEGTLVYFSSENVAIELSRVETAGGQVVQEKTEISPEHGFMAVCIDTEGNRIALHSKK
jgi:predicted enzyme related to lactoylglutathione lyase